MTKRITRSKINPKAIPKVGSEQLKLYLAMQLVEALRRRRYKPRRKMRPLRVHAERSSSAGLTPAQAYMQEELKQAVVDNTIERTNEIKRARATATLEPPQKEKRESVPVLAIAAPEVAKPAADVDGKKPHVPTVKVTESEYRNMMDKWAADAFVEATNAVAPDSLEAANLETCLRRALDEKRITQAVVDEVMALGGHEALPVDQLLTSKKKGHANKHTRQAILLRTPGSQLDQVFANTFRDRYAAQLRATGKMTEPIVKQETEAALKRARDNRLARLGYGAGAPDDAGSRPLSNLDLDKLMRKIPSYLGTFSRDTFPGTGGQTPGGLGGGTPCWIMNTDPSDMPGRHWVAVFIDPVQSKTCEYYDPFGEPCPEDVFNVLAKLVPKISPKDMLKFKENLVVNQSDLTNNCGYFCLRFLLHRLSGKPWTFASGFVDLREDEIERFKRTHPLFKGFTKFV